MAIAFDAIGVGFGEGAKPASFTHVCTGSNLMLIVFAWYQATSGAEGATATYNGVSMTKLQHSDWSGAGVRTMECFYLAAPATGSHTVSVTGSVALIGASSISYTGVVQGAPEANAAISITGGAYSASVTTVASNAWIVSGAIANTGSGFTTGSNTTKRQEISGDDYATLDNNGTLTNNPGSNTLALTDSHNWRGVIISLAPLVSVSPSVSDTSVSSDSLNMGTGEILSDTSTTSDTVHIGFGWGNSSKNTSTWTNTSKP